MKKHSFAGGGFKSKFEDLYEEVNLEDGNNGEGAVCSVRQCRAKSSDKLYALKIIHKQANMKRSKRGEIGRLVIIHHANLIKIKEVFETPTDIYLVLHFASGGELFQRLANRDSYSEYDVSKYVQQITAAIRYLHQHEIPHGNLKPENILCEADDGDQLTVLIGDYAMDWIADDRTVLLHNVWHAAGFTAPETLKGKSFDTPADLWSIGVITYVLLCGYEPFHSDIEAEKYRLILKCQFTYVTADWQDISETAKDFIQRLLVVNPKSRPTASKVLQHGWLNGIAHKHQNLQAAPQKLRQLINARKLKMSTETANSFTAKNLAETFPRHIASLEHLLHETTFSRPPAASDSDIVVVKASTEVGLDLSHEKATGPVSHEDDQLLTLLGIALDTTSSDYSISYSESIPPRGFVFGSPLPWSIPSDGIVFIDKKDIDDYADFFQYQLDLDVDGLLSTTDEFDYQSLPEDIFPVVEPFYV